MVSPFLLHIQHQSTTTTTFHLLKLSMVKILPKAAVQINKLTFGGIFGFHNGFHGKESGFGGCALLVSTTVSMEKNLGLGVVY